MYRHRYHKVGGLYIGKHFTEDILEEVFAYRHRPEDVFIASYPKCGMTWMQHIVYYIYSNGQPPQTAEEFFSKTPFFELMGVETVKNAPRPSAIKTHLPFDKMQISNQAKYLYIARNPFDCCVSFYHHVRSYPMYDFRDGTFDEFFEMFVEGEVDFGDYFDNLLSWYEHRDAPNVLFLTYEGLKKDTGFWIQQVADFLGKQWGQNLRDDPKVLDRILTLTSFETMKKVVNPQIHQFYAKLQQAPVERLPRWAALTIEASGDLLRIPVTGDLVRKGEVGDWRNYFSPDQVKRLQERIAFKTAGSDVMSLWKDLNLVE